VGKPGARKPKRKPKEDVFRQTTPSLVERIGPVRLVILAFAAAVLIFYFKPLFDPDTSIQWDAVDVHYTSQKYFADSLRSGKLPFWTPYVFSGMPFLADPQVGAWYPLNWPFFALGITPRSIEWETALHAFLAIVGGFLLARDLVGSVVPAAFAGVLFGFSGFFAGHSSHTGIFQAASLLPWLLWAARRAMETARWLSVVALISGCLVLTGHFQTALYSFFALACFVVAEFAWNRRAPLRALAVLACAALGAGLLSAMVSLPGLELTAQSDRAHADYRRQAGAALVPGALATLVSPDHYGALENQNYTGPEDITQFLLYEGILLLPLAILGLATPKLRWYGLALLAPGAWYAFGPPGGLYSLVALLPGFRSVRAPVHIWFVAALGLALLAAGGVKLLRTRLRSAWVPLLLLLICGIDLWYWNMDRNALAYARHPFSQLYGDLQDRFRAVAASVTAPPMSRLWAPFDSPGFGPANGPLENRIEVTFGYNPLSLSRYNRYLEVAGAHPKLLDSLAVTAKLNTANGLFYANPAAVPRVFAPPKVVAVGGFQEAIGRLRALDPIKEGIVEGLPSIANNGPAQVRITEYSGDSYRLTYQAGKPTLLRIASPYFPGWRAEIDGRSEPVLPVDVALMGVLAPAGSHELVLDYRPDWFLTGALISLCSWLAVITGLYVGFRKRPASNSISRAGNENASLARPRAARAGTNGGEGVP
jgi:Bacterial membrane protein YfhO